MDVVLVLERLSSAGFLRLNKITGNYYSCYCPLHSDGNERRPSFGVCLQEEVRNGRVYPAGFANCFTCHFSGTLSELITEIMKAHSIPKTGLEWLKEEFPNEDFDDDGTSDMLLPKTMVQQINNRFAINYIKQLMNVKDREFVSEEELASYRFTVPYMYQRGLTDEIIEKYDIGVDMNFIPPGRKNKVPSVTFPVRDQKGNTLFICRRAIDKKAFFIPTGENKSVYGLYELPKHCPVVLICESCFNALTAVKYGVPAVALLGTGTPAQYDQLRSLGVTEFVIGTDPDEAGEIAANKLRRQLKSVAVVRRMHDIPKGKDINDLDEDTFYSLYNNRY